MARCWFFVLLCGATIGPVGDHFHVARGVTEYLTDFGPIWLGNSPLWFAVLVSTFMASLAVMQGVLRPRPRHANAALVLLSPLLVLGLYLTTSFYPLREGGSLEAIITAGALLAYVALDRTIAGLVTGLLVAASATAFEAMLVHFGVFRYLPESDELYGVAPWLIPLYFAASIAVGAIGRHMIGPNERSSDR